MDKEKIISKINQQITDIFGDLIIPEIIQTLSEDIYNNIRKDICPRDLINYHETVKVVEDLRPEKVEDAKTIYFDKMINKIRDALKELKRS